MRFRVGDIVKISKKSDYYISSICNPKNIEGKVIDTADEMLEDHLIKVGWPDEESNVYRENDLRLVRRGE